MTRSHSPVPSSGTAGDQAAASLRMAVLRLAQALRAPATAHGLTPSRLAAMVVLSDRAPIRVGELARRLRITPASASRLVDVLVESDMVQRLADPTDQRAALLSLTERGGRALDAVRLVGLEQLTEHMAALPPNRREALLAAAPALEELADAMAVEPKLWVAPDEGADMLPAASGP